MMNVPEYIQVLRSRSSMKIQSNQMNNFSRNGYQNENSQNNYSSPNDKPFYQGNDSNIRQHNQNDTREIPRVRQTCQFSEMRSFNRDLPQKAPSTKVNIYSNQENGLQSYQRESRQSRNEQNDNNSIISDLQKQIQLLQSENQSLKESLRRERAKKDVDPNFSTKYQEMANQIRYLQQSLEEKDQIIAIKEQTINDLEEQCDQITADYERAVSSMTKSNLQFHQTYQNSNYFDSNSKNQEPTQNSNSNSNNNNSNNLVQSNKINQSQNSRVAVRDSITFQDMPQVNLNNFDPNVYSNINDIDFMLQDLLDQRNQLQKKINKVPPRGGRDQIIAFRSEMEEAEEDLRVVTAKIAKLQFRKKQLSMM